MRTMRSSGFSLVEIMVAIAIAAVILAVGIPQLTRYNANTALSGAMGQMKAALAQASGKARSSASQMTLPSGYDPKNPTTTAAANLTFNTVRVMQEATVVNSQTFREFQADVTLKGPDPGAAGLDMTRAVRVMLYNNDQYVGLVEAFDGSGASVWESTVVCKNGYVQQTVHVAPGGASISVTQ